MAAARRSPASATPACASWASTRRPGAPRATTPRRKSANCSFRRLPRLGGLKVLTSPEKTRGGVLAPRFIFAVFDFKTSDFRTCDFKEGRLDRRPGGFAFG